VKPVARVLALSLSCVPFVALGCVRAPGGVAPSNVPLAPHTYRELGPVTGKDCKVDLLGILPISGGNRVSSAMASALEDRRGADALVGISVDVVSKYFILWSSTCTEVHATAVRFN
jgi:hypothetical protein